MSTLLDDAQSTRVRELLSNYAALLEAESAVYDEQLAAIAELTDYLIDTDNDVTENL